MGEVFWSPEKETRGKSVQIHFAYSILFITHQDAPRKISFTADIWSNQSCYPYLAVTAHWIERNKSSHHLKLWAALIAFHHLQGSHNGGHLVNIVFHILGRVGVTTKVCGLYLIIVIGANHGLGGSLDPWQCLCKWYLYEGARSITPSSGHCLDSNNNRIMCFPHIINICVTHVIKSFTDIDLVDDKAVFNTEPPPSDPVEQTYDEAVECDPIALCHSSVWAIHASGTRHDQFQKIIHDGNEEGWFKSPQDSKTIIQVPEKQLLHDVKTRWDSVFNMISHFHKLWPVSHSQTSTYEHPHHNQIGYWLFPHS